MNQFVAVRYRAGTGGKFLTSWLTCAKLHRTDLNFTQFGDSRNLYFDAEVIFDSPGSDFRFIKTFVAPTILRNTKPPYFYYTNYIDVKDLITKVYKVINISYSVEDIPDVHTIFFCKNRIENEDQIPRGMADRVNVSLHKTIKDYEYYPDPNLLDVPFKELFRGEISILKSKLSDFTQIPIENFSDNMILTWRERTSVALEEFRGTIKLDSALQNNLVTFVKNRYSIDFPEIKNN